MLCSFSIRIQSRKRDIAAGLVHVADDGAASALFDEAHAFPDEDCGAKAVVFRYPAAYGVVVEPGGLGGCVFGAGAPCGGDCCEAVFFVPREGLRGVFAAEFLDQPAMAVVEVAFVFVDPHEVVAHVAFLQVLGAVAQCRLGLVVQDVASGVVLEGLAVGGGVALPGGRVGEGLAKGLLDAACGVVAVAGVAAQAVAALAQFARFVVGVGFHQAVKRVLIRRACAQHGALPVGVAGLVGLGALVYGLAPRALPAAQGVQRVAGVHLALGAVGFAVQGVALDVADELVNGQGVCSAGVALAVVDLVQVAVFVDEGRQALGSVISQLNLPAFGIPPCCELRVAAVGKVDWAAERIAV